MSLFDLNGSKCSCVPFLSPWRQKTFFIGGWGHRLCPVTQGGSDSRRMSCRLGRDLADENGSRLVVREGQWNAHQCVWAVCGAHSAQMVYAFLARDHPVRRLVDRGQCQPPRWHQVRAASLGGQESFDLGSSLSAVNVSSGRTESGGGLSWHKPHGKRSLDPLVGLI